MTSLLNPKLADWLEGRGISVETALHTGIYSARRARTGEPVADSAGDILVFPYLEDGKEVNAKYRGPGKKFWQRANARKTFFNADVLADPSLVEGKYPLVITEGEMDALSFLESGYPFVVSVPDGAPPARDEQGNLIVVPDSADDVDAQHDDKYRYVVNTWDRLSRVKRVILATDGDEPGQRLMQEMARRLGRARCSFVTYPPGCKDANEALMAHGPKAVMDLVTGAKPFPVRGLYKLSEFPDQGSIKTFSMGFPGLEFRPEQPCEPHLFLYHGAFMVVSGLPSGGKSTWTTQLAFNMARIHNWKIVIASFEMRVSPTLRDMLRGFHIGLPRRAWTKGLISAADLFIEDRFSFIALAPEDDDTEADIDWVIERARDAVIREGIDMLIVDPWNEVEHRRRGGETTADYTNRAIRSLKRFAHSNDVATVVVAHPTKQAGVAAKNGEEVTLYDVADGATWANKAEIGVILARASAQDTMTRASIRKVKFRGTGRIGDAYLTYDEDLEAFVA